MGAMPNLLTVSPQAPSTIIIATVIFCVAIFLLLFKQPAGKHRSTKTSAAKLDANKLDVPPVATKPKAYLLFGTQTGTAERFCKSLRAQLMQRYGESMEFEVMDMEDYDAASRLGTESLVFLIAATYGDGEPTDNATVFYNYLVANAQAVADGERPPFLQVCLCRGVSICAQWGLDTVIHTHTEAALCDIWVGQQAIRALLCSWQAL